MERFKQIKGYEGRYWISDEGRLKSLFQGKEIILKYEYVRNGYVRVNLSLGNQQNKKFIHRLVAQAFLANPDDLPYVNHKDRDKLNNTVKNLEWCTIAYNVQHYYATEKAKTRAFIEPDYVFKESDLPF